MSMGKFTPHNILNISLDERWADISINHDVLCFYTNVAQNDMPATELIRRVWIFFYYRCFQEWMYITGKLQDMQPFGLYDMLKINPLTTLRDLLIQSLFDFKNYGRQEWFNIAEFILSNDVTVLTTDHLFYMQHRGGVVYDDRIQGIYTETIENIVPTILNVRRDVDILNSELWHEWLKQNNVNYKKVKYE